MATTKKKPRLNRYRTSWNGPWDALSCPPRILRSWAANKAQALKQHQALFPTRWVKVERISKELGRLAATAAKGEQ